VWIVVAHIDGDLHALGAKGAIARRGKFCDHTVASREHYTAAIVTNDSVNNIAAFIQCRDGADVVLMHKGAVADDVGRENSTKFSFHAGIRGNFQVDSQTVMWA
jgi:hypothetical protein